MAAPGKPPHSYVGEAPLSHDVVRHRALIFIFFFTALLALALSFAVIPAIGRIYDVDIPVMVGTNGAFSNGGQLFCIFIIIYFGTLSMVMFVNFIPSLVVLNLRRWVYFALLSLLLLGSIIGFILSLVYLIEPQLTYDSSHVVASGNDPILASIGAFFCFGFAFLIVLCSGIIAVGLGKPSLSSILYRLLPLRLRAWSWRVIGSVTFFILMG